MKSSRLTLAAAVTVVAASVSLLAGRSLVFAAGQAPIPPPPQSQPGAPPPPPHEMPAPTNLKVLPKNLTGAQVHEIMEKWEGELGTSCKTCHAADPKNLGPNGKPRLNFADDSKEDKQTARKMFKMVEDINANYIAKIDSSGMPVTCGTCHRGHLGPEPFVAPPEAPHAH
jgi:Photosynthetic reaction centre cytochrome C subunit